MPIKNKGKRRKSEASLQTDARIEPAVCRSWKIEIHRRIREMETGQVKGIPLEESSARARKLAGL